MKAQILRSSLLLTMFVGVMALPAALQAQAAVATPAIQETMISASVPGAAMSPSGVTSKLKLAPVIVPTASLAAGEGVGANRAMMGAGMAAVLIGLIVGGDVGTLIAVGGAIFALVGLYRYMR